MWRVHGSLWVVRLFGRACPNGGADYYLLLSCRLHPIRLNLLPAAGHAATDRRYSQLFVSLRQHALRDKLSGIVIRSNRHLFLFWKYNALRLSMHYADGLCDGQLFLPIRKHAFRNILLSASGLCDGQLYLPGRKHSCRDKLPAASDRCHHYLHMRSRDAAFWFKLRFCTSNFQHMD